MAGLIDANASSLRRLQRDLRDLVNENLPFVSARPSGDGQDLFKWSATFLADSGVWRGIPIHVHIKFPGNYPASPPHVSLITRGLVHPNVFSISQDTYYICLDMLNNIGGRPYQGWSGAYSVSAVLMQLYGFLLADEKIDQDYGGEEYRSGFNKYVKLDRAEAMHQLHQCPCGCHELPAAERYHDQQLCQQDDSEGEVTAEPLLHLEELPANVMADIIGRLDPITVTSIAQAAGSETQAGAVANDRVSQLNLFCFFDKARHDESGVVLGYPVLATKYRDGNLRSISIAGYDYIGYRAFKEGNVRKTAWNQGFSDFLPLYLNPKHGARALEVLRETAVTKNLVFCFGKVMNGMLSDLCNDKVRPCDQRMMCDSAIQAFFHMHHMLLAVALSDPAILTQAYWEVSSFATGNTHKRTAPDLGVILIYMMLVPAAQVPWSQFVRHFFRELLARQVRWIEQREHIGTDVTDRSDDWRIELHLKGAKTSLRIVTLSAWFANCVARPQFSHSELAAIKKQLDLTNGQPPQQLQDRFWIVFRALEKGDCFSDYLNVIGVCPRPLPTRRATLARMLRQAVVDSKRAGYHRSYYSISDKVMFSRFDDSDLEVYKGYDVKIDAAAEHAQRKQH